MAMLIADLVPLQDSKRQIRLLRLLPGGDEDGIACKLTAHDIDHSTPDFLAISYTWGEERDSGMVTVYGRPRKVRQNCQYALWQARLHFGTSLYVWIDSICIDQNHPEEKGHQVKLIGRIFGQAKTVLSCVGPTADDSDYMLTFSSEFSDQRIYSGKVASVRGSVKGIEEELPGLSFEDLWQKWEGTKTKPEIYRFFEACQAFITRPYFERLWILQEIWRASSISIACGQALVPWELIHNLFVLREQHKAPILIAPWNWTFETVARLRNRGWIDVYALRLFKCADVRDRIYGTLDICKPMVEIGPEYQSLPDYTKSAYELAVSLGSLSSQMSERRSFYNALRITFDCPDVLRQVDRRRRPDSNAFTRPTEVLSRMTLSCTRLREDKQGRLTCCLSELPFYDRHSEMLRHIKTPLNAEEFCQMPTAHETPQEVYIGNELAVIVCADARVGDYLAAMDPYQGTHLILRPYRDRMYDIVGQAFYGSTRSMSRRLQLQVRGSWHRS